MSAAKPRFFYLFFGIWAKADFNCGQPRERPHFCAACTCNECRSAKQLMLLFKALFYVVMFSRSPKVCSQSNVYSALLGTRYGGGGERKERDHETFGHATANSCSMNGYRATRQKMSPFDHNGALTPVSEFLNGAERQWKQNNKLAVLCIHPRNDRCWPTKKTTIYAGKGQINRKTTQFSDAHNASSRKYAYLPVIRWKPPLTARPVAVRRFHLHTMHPVGISKLPRVQHQVVGAAKRRMSRS